MNSVNEANMKALRDYISEEYIDKKITDKTKKEYFKKAFDWKGLTYS